MRKKIKEAKGITLVALVITIIILLILAGVALSLVIGENGLIAKSKEGVEKYKDKAKAEQWQLEDIEAGMEKIDLAELKDEEEHPELKQMKLLLNITEDNKEIQLPVDTEYKYDCTVNWGDGTTQQVTNENAKTTKHTYENTGEYTLVIEGAYECLYYNDESVQIALKKVEQWGTTGLKYIYLYGCEKLEEVAEPTKNSFANMLDFRYTFARCSNLTSIPEKLFANCPNVTSFSDTFLGCSSITSIPEKLFANCPNATYFEYTFEGCSSITNIPERLFANCPNVTDFRYTFGGGSSITSIPERLFVNCPNVMYFDGVFSDCTSITSIPEKIFVNCPNVTDFSYTFAGCSSITSIPERLFANCPNVRSFIATFAECTSLTGKSIQLWNEEPRQEKGITENSGGEACYYICEKLEDYSQIPNYWKKSPPPILQ